MLFRSPVLSGYCVHLVYVYEFRPAPSPVFEDVKQNVLADWQKEQQEKFNADFYENLKSRYDIVIAEPPVGKVLEAPSEVNADNESKSGIEASKVNDAS